MSIHHQIDFSGKLLLIGAGQAGSVLLRLFRHKPALQIIGVVDKNPEAPGLALAREAGIATSDDYHPFLTEPGLALIINVTGDSTLQEELLSSRPPGAELIGGESARFMWSILDEVTRKEVLEENISVMRREMEQRSPGEFIFGDNPKMQEIRSLIDSVAPTPVGVLIRGESGTGKEGIARLIHKKSLLAKKPLITVNCTAFSQNLIESELFGYKKGAFTGASSDRTGLLELADKGTIFLDEIGDMSLDMQAKLLRFLQSGEIRPVGSTKSRIVTVRIIAATNRDLEQAIRAGEFRQDLFYRINTFTITLPTLSERREDIPALIRHFIRRAEARVNKRVHSITPAAMSHLCAYSWPGNLRELENVIERAVVLARNNVIDIGHLPQEMQEQSPGFDFSEAKMELGLPELKNQLIERIEYEAIFRYLNESGGNVARAARLAKVSRRTFHRLLLRHKINPDDFRK